MSSFAASGLPDEYDRVLRSELADAEQLMWAGQPRPMALAMRSLPISIFGLCFWGFGAFWMVQTMHGPHPGFFPYLGIPFVFIGFLAFLAPVFSYGTAQKTVYAVTNRRAISMVAGASRMVDSYDAKDIDSVQRIDREDGTGNVIFAHKRFADGRGTQAIDIGFYGISQPHEVERMIQALVEDRRAPDGQAAGAPDADETG